MKFSTQVKPITYLKSHAAEIVKTLPESGEPLLITQNGKPSWLSWISKPMKSR